MRSVRVLGRREFHEPSSELDRVLRELVDDPARERFDAAIRVLAASGPQPEALELLADLGTRRASDGDAVRVAHARLRSAMCHAWAGSPEASAEVAVLRCRDRVRPQAQ